MAPIDWKGRIPSHIAGMVGQDPIKELLKYAMAKDIIAFSAGSPAPESFPLGKLRFLQGSVLLPPPIGYGVDLLKYGTAQGFKPLLKQLPEFLDRDNRKVKTKPENIIVTSGSQEALSLLGQMFLQQGDKVAVEKPTYIGALEALKPYNPNYVEIETDELGIIPAALDKAFEENPDIKFLYTIPTFQNPTGKTLPLERRKQIAEVLKKWGQLAIEDDPYSELRYEGEHVQSIQSLAPENVIHLFTFSKTLAPGLRVGGMVFPEGNEGTFSQLLEIKDLMMRLKGGNKLSDAFINQAVVAKYLESGKINKQIQKIIKLYRPRKEAMVETIEEYFPKIFDVSKSEGGMFVWLQLKEEFQRLAPLLNLDEIEKELKEHKVALAQGKYFFADPKTNEVSMRLNFTNQSEDNIRKGIRIIGEVLEQRLQGQL